MLRTLRELITGQAAAPLTSTPASRPPEIQVAAAALLVQLAHADGEFSPAERAQVEAALVRHFNLDPATIAEIVSLAEHEQKQSIDDFRFTRVIREHFDVGQRMVLAEIMWGSRSPTGESRIRRATCSENSATCSISSLGTSPRPGGRPNRARHMGLDGTDVPRRAIA